MILHCFSFTRLLIKLSICLIPGKHANHNTTEWVANVSDSDKPSPTRFKSYPRVSQICLTLFYRVNVCLLFVLFGALICEPHHRTKMPRNKIKQDTLGCHRFYYLAPLLVLDPIYLPTYEMSLKSDNVEIVPKWLPKRGIKNRR
jgi:hypothetical protein